MYFWLKRREATCLCALTIQAADRRSCAKARYQDRSCASLFAGIDLLGRVVNSRAAFVDETTIEVIRHELPHFLRVELCATLVRSVEP